VFREHSRAAVPEPSYEHAEHEARRVRVTPDRMSINDFRP
jgi:hypothetical protein